MYSIIAEPVEQVVVESFEFHVKGVNRIPTLSELFGFRSHPAYPAARRRCERQFGTSKYIGVQVGRSSCPKMAMESYENNPEASKHKRQAYGRSAQQWREMRGISQDAMARALGLSDAKAISRRERGEAPWSLDLLEKYAEVVDAGSVMNLLSPPDRVHIAHANQANPYGTNISYHEASAKEREQLLERIKHLEEEVLHLRKSEEFLREQLKKAQGS